MNKEKATLKRDLVDLSKVLENALEITWRQEIAKASERSTMWNNLIAVIRRDVKYALDDLNAEK
jgi:hypothetical protein